MTEERKQEKTFLEVSKGFQRLENQPFFYQNVNVENCYISLVKLRHLKSRTKKSRFLDILSCWGVYFDTNKTLTTWMFHVFLLTPKHVNILKARSWNYTLFYCLLVVKFLESKKIIICHCLPDSELYIKRVEEMLG